MYESLYEKLPSLDAYCKRIGFLSADHARQADLSELIFAHQCAVPFENLDIFDFKKQISLSIDDLFDKIVTRNRGGYCVELNAMFCQLLSELGYDAYPCMARVLFKKQEITPMLHRATIVNQNGVQLFCDVGFGGPMPQTALELAHNLRQQSGEQAYKFEKEPHGWWTLYKVSDNKSEPVLSLSQTPVHPVDFICMNFFGANSPNALFTQKRLVNLRTSSGYKSIEANTLTTTCAGKTTSKELPDYAELQAALKEHFGILI